MASNDLFERYFLIADSDGNGRIDGQEAVSFFRGSGLPQPVLAKIWQFADYKGAGFLTRPEFFNALKLVTVAQSGRELTPELVQAAMATQTPPPRINLPQPPSNFPPHPPQYPRPPTPTPAATPPQLRPLPQPQPRPRPHNQYQFPVPAANQHHHRPPVPRNPSPVAFSDLGALGAPVSTPAPPLSLNKSSPKPPPPDDLFGTRQDPVPLSPATSVAPPVPHSLPELTAKPPTPKPPPQTPLNPSPPVNPTPAAAKGFDFDFGLPNPNPNPRGSPSPSVNLAVASNPAQAPVPAPVSVPAPAAVLAVAPSLVDQPPPGAAPSGGVQFRRMTVEEAKRYTQIFAQVDLDRDHKITGIEAKKLFLGFGVPKEILKQVWEVSDQDKDGMLSLREFCSAMYFIDRFREGAPVPRTLPPGIHIDDPSPAPDAPPPAPSKTDIAAARVAEAVAALEVNSKPAPWRLDPTMLEKRKSDEGEAPARQPVQTAVGQMPVPAADASAAVTAPLAYASRAPAVDASKAKQLGPEEAENLERRLREAQQADRKVWTVESGLMDSKQKIDFYRTKMQEIVMFKSRCENKLNEILEQAAAEKREVESLAKMYDEKYFLTQGITDRLAQEELALRDLEEKKQELQTAVSKLLQGGHEKDHLQERADRLAADLEDLRKSVNKRAKELGLTVRPILGSEEVPFGWLPGLQDNAIEWDDEWHEFDDDGFSTVEDIGEGIPDIFATEKAVKSLPELPEPEPNPKPPTKEAAPQDPDPKPQDPSPDPKLQVPASPDPKPGVEPPEEEDRGASSEESESEVERKVPGSFLEVDSLSTDVSPEVPAHNWTSFEARGGQGGGFDELYSASAGRKSWDINSNNSSTQVSFDFGGVPFKSATGDRFQASQDFSVAHREGDGESDDDRGPDDDSDDERHENEKEEEEEEDLDPFAALIRKRAGSYTSFVNWGDDNAKTEAPGIVSGFGSFSVDGVHSYDVQSSVDEKEERKDNPWSAF